METPYITHITAEDFEHVYEPAEDTFLLIDALELDLPLFKMNPPTVFVEIGSGSGIVITAIAKALHSTAAFFGIDINPRACSVSKRTAQRNAAKIDCLNMDLLSSFKERSVDVLIFNPPYVVTPDDELGESMKGNSGCVQNELITKSWAGGRDGRQIMNKVFEKLNDILTIGGVAYVLVIKDNRPDEIVADLKEIKFKASFVIERKIRGEHLFVIKIERC